MNDVSVMEIFYCAACLDEEPPDFRHGEVLPLLDGICEGTIVTDLQNDISALLKRECAVEFHDIWMLQL